MVAQVIPDTQQNEIASRVDRRVNEIEHNVEWIHGQVLAMVASWSEVFEFASKHARWEFDRFSDRLPARMGDLKENLEDELDFYRRCNEIYTEEMAEAEAFAAQARARVADRIERELKGDKDLADAIRENDPQKWTLGFEWN